MSGVGFSELVILFLIGLIVLGPERLPRVANQLGSWLGQARRMTRVMKRQLEEELDLEGKPKNDLRPPQSRAEQFPPKSAAPGVDPEPAAAPHDSANEHDDTYSPAHDADAPGTGVDDDAVDNTSGEDTTVEERDVAAEADAPRTESAKETVS